MSLGNQVTGTLNKVEEFTQNSAAYMFPFKVLGWVVLFLALLVTNFIAIAKWPISAAVKKLNKKAAIVGEPINITSDDKLKTVISEENIVLVDFWAEWCGPCLLMNKTIHDVAQEYAGKVTVVKIDVSLNTTLSKLYAVRGLPTVIVFKNGVEAKRKSGSLTKNQLVGLIAAS